MSLTRAELDALRALIRERSGLPDPPPKPVLAPWCATLPVAPEPAQPIGQLSAPAPPATPASVLQAVQPAPAAPRNDTEREAETTWRPDTALHRLGELLAEMRALSGEAIDPSALAA